MSVPLPVAESRSFSPFDWLLLVTAAGIWGSSFLCMDVALESEHPGLVTFLRPLLGLAVLLFIPSARQPIRPSDRKSVIYLAITWMTLPLTLFPLAQQWIDSSVAGMLNGAMPIGTVLVAHVGFGQRSGLVQMFGIFTGIVGIVIVGFPTASLEGTSALGVGLVLVAVISYGFAANLAAPLQRRYGSPAVLIRVLAIAVMTTMPFGVYGVTQSSFSVKSCIANLGVGLGGTGVAYLSAATLAGRVGAVRMSVVTYLVPVVAAGLGVAFLGEALNISQILGAVILISGAWMTTRPAS